MMSKNLLLDQENLSENTKKVQGNASMRPNSDLPAVGGLKRGQNANSD